MSLFKRNNNNANLKQGWTSTSEELANDNENFGSWNGSNLNSGYDDSYGNNYNGNTYQETGYAANNTNGAVVGGNNWNSRKGWGNNRNSYRTPFGTPGFASENLLADNPWTHDNLGYDYYDYYADQRVRGPFGVAPGSVVPPSQRHLFGGLRGRKNNNTNNNLNNSTMIGPQQQQPHRRFGFLHRNKGNNAPQPEFDQGYTGPQKFGSSGADHTGLNRGVIPMGAANAVTNQPFTQGGQTYYNERVLPDGSYEQVEQEVYSTTQQDIVPNARGINGGRSRRNNNMNTMGTNNGNAQYLPTNIPSTNQSSTTVSSIVIQDGNGNSDAIATEQKVDSNLVHGSGLPQTSSNTAPVIPKAI